VLDLTEVRYVKRIVVGSDSPTQIRTCEEVGAAEALLNRCLSDTPRGSIIAVEKSFTVLQVGEHQVVLQWLCYHVGFSRRPIWLSDQGGRK
jgi:hypothetical protein